MRTLLSKIVAVFIVVAVLVSCGDDPGKPLKVKQDPRLVVLSVNSLTGGPLKGTFPCENELGQATFSDPCLPDPSILAQAALNCGPVEVTIDVSANHVSYVYFPSSSLGRRNDLDVVRCIQRRVGFRFAAGSSVKPPADAKFEPVDRFFDVLQSRDPEHSAVR